MCLSSFFCQLYADCDGCRPVCDGVEEGVSGRRRAVVDGASYIDEQRVERQGDLKVVLAVVGAQHVLVVILIQHRENVAGRHRLMGGGT